MLTQVTIQNVKGNTLSLPLSDYSGGYLVKEIDGLDPVNATVTSTSLAQVDGAQAQFARRDIRNITLKLGLMPNYVTTSVGSLATALYNYFLPKATVVLSFYIDGILFATSTGTVESCSRNPFTQDPEVDISIICYDPDFYGPQVSLSGSTEDSTLLTSSTITYPGSSDAGVIFTLNVNRSITGFSMTNVRPDGTTQVFSFAFSLINGDVVTMNTVPGSKGITLTRSGLKSSLMAALQGGGTWIALEQGDNLFRANVSGATIPWTMVYTPKYGALL